MIPLAGNSADEEETLHETDQAGLTQNHTREFLSLKCLEFAWSLADAVFQIFQSAIFNKYI